jgi:predicted negative regulator of RcsB-dependent stress response
METIVLFALATLIGWVSILTWSVYSLMQQLKKAKAKSSVFENLGD